LVDKFDGSDVVAAVPEHSAERLVERVDVAAAAAALVGDEPSELERHLGWMPTRKTETRCRCGVSRRHFCRSIQTRFRYQS
jgi:hypothetical protein